MAFHTIACGGGSKSPCRIPMIFAVAHACVDGAALRSLTTGPLAGRTSTSTSSQPRSAHDTSDLVHRAACRPIHPVASFALPATLELTFLLYCPCTPARRASVYALCLAIWLTSPLRPGHAGDNTQAFTLEAYRPGQSPNVLESNDAEQSPDREPMMGIFNDSPKQIGSLRCCRLYNKNSARGSTLALTHLQPRPHCVASHSPGRISPMQNFQDSTYSSSQKRQVMDHKHR